MSPPDEPPPDGFEPDVVVEGKLRSEQVNAASERGNVDAMDKLQADLGFDFQPEAQRPPWTLGKWFRCLSNALTGLNKTLVAGDLPNDGADIDHEKLVGWMRDHLMKRLNALKVVYAVGGGWTNDARIWVEISEPNTPEPCQSGPLRGLYQCFPSVSICPKTGNLSKLAVPRKVHPDVARKAADAIKRKIETGEDTVIVKRDRGVGYKERTEHMLAAMDVRHLSFVRSGARAAPGLKDAAQGSGGRVRGGDGADQELAEAQSVVDTGMEALTVEDGPGATSDEPSCNRRPDSKGAWGGGDGAVCGELTIPSDKDAHRDSHKDSNRDLHRDAHRGAAGAGAHDGAVSTATPAAPAAPVAPAREERTHAPPSLGAATSDADADHASPELPELKKRRMPDGAPQASCSVPERDAAGAPRPPLQAIQPSASEAPGNVVRARGVTMYVGPSRVPAPSAPTSRQELAGSHGATMWVRGRPGSAANEACRPEGMDVDAAPAAKKGPELKTEEERAIAQAIAEHLRRGEFEAVARDALFQSIEQRWRSEQGGALERTTYDAVLAWAEAEHTLLVDSDGFIYPAF